MSDDLDYDALAAEAERGYDVETIRTNPGGITPLYAVAWALWANDDAAFSGGVYVPDPNELELARLFIEALAQRGFSIVRSGNDEEALYRVAQRVTDETFGDGTWKDPRR